MTNEARIRELVKAGALILAELERLDEDTEWLEVLSDQWADTAAILNDCPINSGELALAAAMYATPPEIRGHRAWCPGCKGFTSEWDSVAALIRWPWDAESFKPGDET